MEWGGTVEEARRLFADLRCIRTTIENAHPVREHVPHLRVLCNDTNRARRSNRNIKPGGLCLLPDGIRTGMNSGFQAINLLVHTGVRKIILLGYDMRVIEKKSHWFGEHPRGRNDFYGKSFIPVFRTLVEPLKELGVDVVNCTPDSALDAFRKSTLETEL